MKMSETNFRAGTFDSRGDIKTCVRQETLFEISVGQSYTGGLQEGKKAIGTEVGKAFYQAQDV